MEARDRQIWSDDQRLPHRRASTFRPATSVYSVEARLEEAVHSLLDWREMKQAPNEIKTKIFNLTKDWDSEKRTKFLMVHKDTPPEITLQFLLKRKTNG